MRVRGRILAPPRERHSHVGWVFREPAEFLSGALEFLRAGHAAGERLLYVRDASATQLADELAPLGGVADRLRDGSLLLLPLAEAYADEGLEPAEQAARFAALADEAVAEGFAGMRVAADVTPLVADAIDRRAFAEYELAVDAVIADRPLAGMCGFDANVLGREVAALTAIHPSYGSGPGLREPGFSLSYGDSGTALHVTGEIDIANHDLFEGALGIATTAGDDAGVHLDAAGLEFIDIGGIRLLGAFRDELATQGRRLDIHGLRPILREAFCLVGYDALNSSPGGECR